MVNCHPEKTNVDRGKAESSEYLSLYNSNAHTTQVDRIIQTVIQQIILTNKRKSTTILLKMDSSIQDMKVHYIEKGRSIIGIGKTPHLGSCCVSLLSKSSNPKRDKRPSHNAWNNFCCIKNRGHRHHNQRRRRKISIKSSTQNFPSAYSLQNTKDNIYRNPQDEIGYTR